MATNGQNVPVLAECSLSVNRGDRNEEAADRDRAENDEIIAQDCGVQKISVDCSDNEDSLLLKSFLYN